MRLLLLSLISSCAAINTAGLSESCRNQYDACLNACPGVARGSPAPTSITQMEIAGCTDECNRRARSCGN